MKQSSTSPDIGNSVRSNRSNWRSKLNRLSRLASKELVEILRDRRTIITLVLMPLLVYPLMGIVVQKLMLQTVTKNRDLIYRIGFESEEEFKRFSQIFHHGQSIIQAALDQETKSPDDPGTSELGKPNPPRFEAFYPEDLSLEQLVQMGNLDLGVVRSQDSEDSGTQGISYRLLHNPASEFSRNAMQFIGKRMRLANDHFVRRVVGGNNGPVKLPASYLEQTVEVKSQQPSLLTFVPLMLVLMTITGAVYPAIDVTAGERERGTMEILVAAPVPRLYVLIGKFVAVFAVATLTAMANLLAMVVTIYALGIDVVIFGETGVDFGKLALIFVLLLVLAGFFSATLLGLTSFARSFKEAQAYLIPLMLVAFAPGLISLTPNLETSPFLAVVPLVNMVMVGRDLLAGQANTLHIFIAIISTLIYGLLALSVAAKVFGTDAMLMGGKSGWSDFLSVSKTTKPAPEISTAMLFIAVLFPMFILLSGLSSNIAGKQGASIEQRLWINAAVTVVLFVGLPWLFSSLGRLRFPTTFFLGRPPILGMLAALFLGTSVWTIAYEMEILSLSNERIDLFMELFEKMRPGMNEIPLWVKLVCLAAAPAICEELTFRGFLLSAFKARFHAAVAIIATSVLFGLFHIFVGNILMFERMIPSTFLGLLLGLICIRTGSIYPGMLLHVIHNGLMITMAHHENLLQEWGVGMSEQEHLPSHWLGIALIPIVLGITLLVFTRRTRTNLASTDSSDN